MRAPRFAALIGKLCRVFLTAAVALACAHGSPATDALERGRAAMRVAVTGDPASLETAIDAFRQAVADNPDDALARAHLGAALVWKVRDVALPRKKAQAKAGFTELDAAVAMAPDDPEVRLVRARLGSILPQMLGYHETVTADLAWLVEVARAPARDLPDGLRRRIFHQAAAFALRERRQSEARQLLEDALAAEGDEPSDAELQSMLALAQGPFTPLGHGHAEAQEPPAASGP